MVLTPTLTSFTSTTTSPYILIVVSPCLSDRVPVALISSLSSNVASKEEEISLNWVEQERLLSQMYVPKNRKHRTINVETQTAYDIYTHASFTDPALHGKQKKDTNTSAPKAVLLAHKEERHVAVLAMQCVFSR